MRLHSYLQLGLVLLIGGLLASGCTPGSSQSPPAPDTVASHTAESAVEDGPSDDRSTRPSTASPSMSPRTVAQRLADASVKARIKQALVRQRALRPFTFFPEVVQGQVSLRGDVNTKDQYRRAERIARAVEGVEALTNQLTIEGRLVSENEGSGASPGSEAVYHTVRSGDTLWQIAREYGVSVEQIESLNSGSLSSLHPGDRLRVR